MQKTRQQDMQMKPIARAQVNTLRCSVTEIATVTENVCDLSSVSGLLCMVPLSDA